MKWLIFGLLLTIYSPLGFAENTDTATPGATAAASDAVDETDRSDQLIENSALDKIIDSDTVVKAEYEKCLETKKTAPATDIGDCIWKGLDEAKREELSNELAAGEDDQKKEYEGLNINTVKRTKSKAITALESYLEKKLELALYGEERSNRGANGKAKDKKDIMMDHNVFHRLYKSQLGKNVISSLSSYCIEADPGKSYLISESAKDRRDQREENIKLLQSPAIDGKQAGATQWNLCIVNVAPICAKEVQVITKEDGTTANGINYKSDTSVIGKSDGDDDEKARAKIFKYSNQRACEVVAFIKSAKQSIKAMAIIQKKFEENKSNNFGNAKTYDVEKMTTLSSNEFINEKGDTEESFAEANAAEAKKAKECIDDIQNPDCTKYFNTDSEGSQKLVDEFSLRSKIQLEKVNTKIKDSTDEEGVKKYLTEQGIEESKIADIIQNPDELDKIKKKIAERYKNERTALIDSMNDRLKKKTFATAESEGGDQAAADAKNKTTMENIETDLASKTEEYKQLIFFNNVVSSYLQVGSGESATQNTRSRFIELNDSAFNDQGRAPGSTDTPLAGAITISFDDIKTNNPAEDSGGSGQETNLEIKDINTILGN